jgi:hypothetical protein
MADPRGRTLTVRNVEKIAERLLKASAKMKRRPKLQMDVFLAARLLIALLRTGVINGPVDLQ